MQNEPGPGISPKVTPEYEEKRFATVPAPSQPVFIFFMINLPGRCRIADREQYAPVFKIIGAALGHEFSSPWSE